MSGRGRHPSPRGPAVSRKLLICCAIGGVVLLYVLYSGIGSSSDKTIRSGSGRLKRFKSWKTQDFVDIPTEVLEKAKTVKIEERELEFKFEGEQLSVFFREVGARGSGAKRDLLPVLLLHGAGSSSEVWEKVETIQLLGALGYRAVALDLPGWAKSQAAKVSMEQSGRFLARFIEQEKLDRPLLVSPSMAGRFAIPYIMEPEPSTCHNRLRAYVPLAPVSTSAYKHSEYHRCEIPVMIVYGSKDKNLGLESVGNLRNMPNNEIFPMEGAGHANYEERPQEWNRLLYNFLLALQREAD